MVSLMRKRKSLYSRMSSSLSVTQFFSCFDVESMYSNFFPSAAPAANRMVTPLSLPTHTATAEASAAFTAGEAGHISSEDEVVMSGNTEALYQFPGARRASSRMKYLSMLPDRRASKQNLFSMIDLPPDLEIDQTAELILEQHIELMSRRKPDEQSYNISNEVALKFNPTF